MTEQLQLGIESLRLGSDSPCPILYIDSEEVLLNAQEEISRHPEVAFDTEGVDLGREGPLTIAILHGLSDDIKENPIYIVDVQILGERVFEKAFRAILEDPAITKVTFDCRSDSDALYHQFGITLSGVTELQVLDQAVRIQNGEAPPTRCTYVENGGIPFLQGMAKVAARYLDVATRMKFGALGEDGPHKRDPKVWGKRPLPDSTVEYAANEVRVIKALWTRMCGTKVADSLMNAVKTHSARYEGQFRDRAKKVHFVTDKVFIMEEHPIVGSDALPSSHAMRAAPSIRHAQSKWDQAVRALRAKEPSKSVFNEVLFILQHNDWYSDKGRVELQRLARAYPHFTAKQRSRIANPPPLERDDDDDDLYCDDGDDDDAYGGWGSH